MAQLNQVKSVSVAGFGKLPLNEKASAFTPAGEKREHKAGAQATDGGYISTPTPAKLDAKLNATAGIDLDALLAVKDATVTVRLSDGRTYMMPHAFCTEAPDVQDGESKVTFLSNTSELI